jgi:hypothetical protein
MRRFLIWSVLAAVVGLVLAGTGYWAYWNFYSRFQPVTITRNQAQIQQLLDEASWVSGGGGGGGDVGAPPPPPPPPVGGGDSAPPPPADN